jgi:hypothetical protein
MFFLATLRRAFASNLQTIRSSAREREKLSAAGVEHSTIQNYLVWRRGVLLFVVICTVVSTALLTYQTLYETSDHSQILSSIETQLEEYFEEELPSSPDSSIDASGSHEFTNEEEATTTFGEIAYAVESLSWYALPLAAFAAAIFWTRFRITHRVMLIAFVFSFLFPMLLALCPWSWSYTESNDGTLTPTEKRTEAIAYGIAYGVEYLITLLPTVLSLVPGVQRACLRVKTLLPQSVLPGWLLVAASPFYALVLLVMFVAINQVASGPYFFVGMLLLLSAPLFYCIRADIVTRPLTTPESFQSLRIVQVCVSLTTAMAGALLLFFIAGIEVLGLDIVGLSPESSLMHPIDIAQLVLETIGRSMFMTVLGADLLMQMNLSAWRNQKNFFGTEEAVSYGSAMEQMQRVANSTIS